ncbi:MAG: histidine phosphatase family protein [Thermodesulfobacteriota bacterium]
MQPLKLIIIRHGETVENASRIVQGHLPGTLSERGREQVRGIALTLEREKLDAVYSSDLERAHRTAEILMEGGGGREAPTIKTDERLREQGFGIYEGKPSTYILRQMKREGKELMNFIPEGGEKYSDFQGRVRSFLDEVKEKHSGETVLLVTHNGVIRILLDALSTGMLPYKNPVANGTVIVAAIDRSGHATVEHLNPRP